MSRPRLLILSPHSDDTAFSLGGLLAAGRAFAGWERHQLTLFVHSQHAPYAPHLTEASAITAVRCREDEAFCAAHEITLTRAGMTETLLRGYASKEAIYAPRAPETDPLFAPTCRVVKEATAGFDLVVAPLGVGGHVEHILVREACRRSGSLALFYEDLPYAGDFTNDALDRFGATAMPGAQCRAFVVEDAMDRKCERLLDYESQVAPADLEKVIAYSRRRRPGPAIAWSAPPAPPESSGGAVEVLWGPAELLARADLTEALP